MKIACQICAVLLSVTVGTYGQGNSFKDIRYQGGTLQTKVKADNWGNRLTVTSDEIKLELKDGQTYKIDCPGSQPCCLNVRIASIAAQEAIAVCGAKQTSVTIRVWT